MKLAELIERTSFGLEDLLASAHGTLLDSPDELPDMARLPAPPMLMFDRITEIERGSRGRIVAEQDIRPDAWYFQCHFVADPVQPGCLGVDAVWQLLGFYMTLCGCPGKGRALGAQEIEFTGQIRPFDRLVRYELEVRRFTRLKDSGTALAVGDALVSVDGQPIYRIKGAKTGLFRGIAYDDYPRRSAGSRGGEMKR